MNSVDASAKIRIRLAQPHEGALVGDVFHRCGGSAPEWIDWSNVYPYWMIGEVAGEPRGVIMVSPARPFGHLEFLSVDPTLPHREKAQLVRDLGYAGIATCQAAGCTAVLACCDWNDERWVRVMTRRGWTERAFGSFLMKRVQDVKVVQ